MALDQSGLAAIHAEFEAFLRDLTSVEKKVIHALTDVARDILRTRPQGAPVVVAVIIERVLQAPVSLKLPTLYLLDSIVKLVGEPYTTYFAAKLPEAFAATWHTGNTNLQRSLQKLYSTWNGVFSQQVLTEIAARIAQPPASAVPRYVASAIPSYYPAAQPIVEAQVVQPYGFAQPALVAAQPLQAAFGYLPQGQAQQQAYVQQQVAVPIYATPLQDGVQYPPFITQQQQQQQPVQSHQLAQPAVNVADLMASLVNSGILAAPAQPNDMQTSASAGVAGDSTPPAAATPLRPEESVSLEFTPERIKDRNPAAVQRLLEQTEITKGRFLDRKFLRRQRHTGTLRISRLWYVDLDTWMASTVAGGTVQAAQQHQEAAAAAAAAPPEKCSVPVDESQTHCVLSGERFQQFWDEQHQEWRYKDAKRLDKEEAARYGLHEGALVLVSALGAPSGNVLQPTTGVLSTMTTQQEIAADLAAATAAASTGDAAAGPEDVKESKAGIKHEREEVSDQQLEQKRLRVH